MQPQKKAVSLRDLNSSHSSGCIGISGGKGPSNKRAKAFSDYTKTTKRQDHLCLATLLNSFRMLGASCLPLRHRRETGRIPFNSDKRLH